MRPSSSRGTAATRTASLEELLADERVDLVVNLTAPTRARHRDRGRARGGQARAHGEAGGAPARRGRASLAALAERRGVRLSCAPATLLGEAQQTAWKLVRDGALGEVRVCLRRGELGPDRSWHPSPETLYEAGPVVDVGIYPLTILTAMFGPVRSVRAYGATIQAGAGPAGRGAFRLSTPDFTVAGLELEYGVVVRLTATFWVGPGKQRGIEFHGQDELALSRLLGGVRLATRALDRRRVLHRVPLVRDPYRGIDWSRALVELADAVAHDRPHRAGAEQAAHVVEVLEAIAAAAQRAARRRPVELRAAGPAAWAM